MLPKITELEFNTLPNEAPDRMRKSFLFDFEKCEFITNNGRIKVVEGKGALKVWIIKVIRTEKFRFRIYENEEYGTTLEDLTGSSFPRAFIESEIEREVKSSLMNHRLIQSVNNWKFERVKEKMYISFQVVTYEGSFDMEVSL